MVALASGPPAHNPVNDRIKPKKRAVLNTRNIEKSIQNGVYAGPLPPSTLSFSEDEKMYIAMRVEDAKKLGSPEFVYLYTFGEYLGENDHLAAKIYGEENRKWKYFWKLKKVEVIVPFSLKELVSRFSGDKEAFYKIYRGENLNTKTVTDIEPEHEQFFLDNTTILETLPSGNIEEDIYNLQTQSSVEEVENLPEEQLLKKIEEKSKSNEKAIQGMVKRKRAVSSYQRDPQIGGWLQSLYQNKCQICGDSFIIPSTRKHYSEHHHIVPVSNGGKNTKENIIVVCPTCHKKFDRGFLKADLQNKKIFYFSEKENKFNETSLKFDKHLFV